MATEQRTAETGNSVTIHYSIAFPDGTKVQESKTKRPLSFKLGRSQVFPKLEQGILGMALNERRAIRLQPEEAYGSYNKELVMRVERKVFPEDIVLRPGRTVQYQTRNGERSNFVVNAVDDKSVTIDGNHPLAGLEVIYEVELVSIN